jgi:hypothetical protein
MLAIENSRGIRRAMTGWTEGAPMPVTLLCPNLRCRAILQVPDACRGKKVRCGQCGITLSVPAGSSQTAPAEIKEPGIKAESSDAQNP